MNPEKSLLHLVHRVSQVGAERFAAIHGYDLRPRQLMVLRALESLPGASQTALVAATGVDRSTMADIVRRLVARGLVKRKRSRSDARTYVLNLSSEGKRAIEQAGPALANVEAKMLEAVPAKMRDAFIDALEKLADVSAT